MMTVERKKEVEITVSSVQINSVHFIVIIAKRKHFTEEEKL